MGPVSTEKRYPLDSPLMMNVSVKPTLVRKILDGDEIDTQRKP